MNFRQYRSNRLRVFNIELASPKAFKNSIVIGAKLTLALAFSPQHANRGNRGIPYFARSKNYETALFSLSSAIHVRVAHPAPLVRVPIGLNDFPTLI